MLERGGFEHLCSLARRPAGQWAEEREKRVSGSADTGGASREQPLSSRCGVSLSFLNPRSTFHYLYDLENNITSLGLVPSFVKGVITTCLTGLL